MTFTESLSVFQKRVETSLDKYLPLADIKPFKLHEAMRYAVLGEGKRIRPVLVYASGAVFGVAPENLDAPACAVEIMHAYSLIHDDLPAMDDDELRRGKPTCHVAYDEATAILAGDALQALAFEILANEDNPSVSAEQRLLMLNKLANASGSRGMAGGQAIDLDSVGKKLDLAELETMHLHKTGALITASVELGALSSPAITDDSMHRISAYGKYIGLAFQVQDDILDIESDTETLGKPQGSDIARDKPTYPELLGLEGARKTAERYFEQAISSLDGFDHHADLLRGIAEYIVHRVK